MMASTNEFGPDSGGRVKVIMLFTERFNGLTYDILTLRMTEKLI